MSYWTFFEPSHKGVELADVLLMFGDAAVLFEAKTRGVAEPASEWWLREKLQEAVNQLSDRAALLRSGNVVLRNSLRGEVAFDATRIKDLYGIVVLVANHQPFEWRELAKDAFERATIPIQVFSLFDLAEVLRVFDTPLDLLVYFEARDRYGRDQRMLVGKELDTFGEVLGNLHLLWEKAADHPEVQEYLIDLSNAVFRTPLANERGCRAWASSRLIDCALRPADRKADPDSTGRRVGSPEHTIFLAALEAIAEQSRLRRSNYGEFWLLAADEAVSEGRVAFRRSFSPSRSRSYVLVATPIGQDPTQELIARYGLTTMAEHGTTSCLALGAPAASIRATFEVYLRWCRREEAELHEDLVLAPTFAWIGPLENST